MEIADMFGYAGMAVGVSFMLPQVYRTYRTKSVEDISWGMLILLFLNCILWFSYGFLRDSTPLLLTNALGFIVVSTQIALKIRYRNNP